MFVPPGKEMSQFESKKELMRHLYRQMKVLNKKDLGRPLDKTYEVYVGRGPYNGEFGNPFSVGRDGTLEEVLQLYDRYLDARPDLIARFPELLGKHLVCYCAPAPCHADILLKKIGKWIEEQ